MNTVERVARAIYEKSPLYVERPNIGDAMRSMTWDEAARYGHEDYYSMARAALTALREPSEAMIDDGEIAVDDCEDSGKDSYGTYSYIDGRRAAFEAWQSMIDAALAEGGDASRD